MSASIGGRRLVIASQHDHTLVVRHEQQREKREESRERSEKREAGSEG